jgi:hypothetical protein
MAHVSWTSGYVKSRRAVDASGRTSRQQQQQCRHHRPQAALHALSKHASCALEGVPGLTDLSTPASPSSQKID